VAMGIALPSRGSRAIDDSDENNITATQREGGGSSKPHFTVTAAVDKQLSLLILGDLADSIAVKWRHCSRFWRRKPLAALRAKNDKWQGQ